MIRRALSLCLPIALAACAGTATPPAPPAPASGERPAATSADALFRGYWEASLELNPLIATYVGDPRYNAELPNTLSAEFRARERAFDEQWLARARALDGAGLDAQDRLSVEILQRDLQLSLDGDRFPGHLMPINQFYNLASQYAQLGSGTGAQPFDSVADYQDWLARAGRIPLLFEQAIANMREGVDRQVVQPRILIEKALAQLDALIVDDPTQTLFWGPIERMPDDIAAADAERLGAAYRSLIADTLMPAYRQLRDYLRDDYLPHTRESVGLGALPDGDAWYAYNVRRITTTDLTPMQIHRIGLDEVARIHGQMRAVIDELGFDGDLQAFFRFLDEDPRFEFASEQALLDAYNGLREKVDAGVPALFSTVPRAGFEIRPVEPFRAASAAGGSYMRPSQDGSRPGIFYVNTYDLPSRKTWDMEDLYLHEAIPGHHFQIARQQELEDVPAFRRFGGYTAFVEGWGLYAESLGRELGVYQDPYSYFGYLQNELWRAIRLVVDTGLHAKGWTRQQTIDYMLANSAISETQAVAEAERYMAIPGQALAYKIGELKIKELRARAETALGAAFDIRAFHEEVLKDGAVPLDLLEDKIDAWIAAQT